MAGTSLIDIFEVIIGIYMIYAAITGQGKIFANEYIVKGKEEEYHKLLRLFCAVSGPLCLITALFDYLKLVILSFIVLGVLMAVIVSIVVMTQKITVHRTAKHK